MKKVKAFTLVELVIGMVIGSLVMGICYSAFGMAESQFRHYRTKRVKINRLMEFNSAFQMDFVQSGKARFSDGTVLLAGGSYEKEYRFMDTCVVRTVNAVSDTFNIGVMEVIANPCPDTKEELIDGISFNVVLFKEIYSMHYTKTYAAETFMN